MATQEQEESLRRMVTRMEDLLPQFAKDFPDTAHDYAAGKNGISPLGVIFGAAAYGMYEMGMSQEEVVATLAKGLEDLTGSTPTQEQPPAQE